MGLSLLPPLSLCFLAASPLGSAPGLSQLGEKIMPVTQKGFWELTPSSKRLKPETSITDVYRPLVCLPNTVLSTFTNVRLIVSFSILSLGFAGTSHLL